MKRREFISLLGGVAATWPLAAQAQQPSRIAKIGHLESGFPSSSPNLVAAFRRGLREFGYIEGQNLFIERRYAEGREERLPQLARELVEYGVDVIFIPANSRCTILLPTRLSEPPVWARSAWIGSSAALSIRPKAPSAPQTIPPLSLCRQWRASAAVARPTTWIVSLSVPIRHSRHS